MEIYFYYCIGKYDVEPIKDKNIINMFKSKILSLYEYDKYNLTDEIYHFQELSEEHKLLETQELCQLIYNLKKIYSERKKYKMFFESQMIEQLLIEQQMIEQKIKEQKNIDYDCAICIDKMDNINELKKCSRCKRYIHKECYEEYIKTAHKIDCIYCRNISSRNVFI